MSQTIKDQLKHRTIRFFKDKPVPQETLEQLWEVMNRTASSNGLQSASIIRITDPKIKQELSVICRQHYVADLPELYVFIVDSRRMGNIAMEKGYEGDNYRNMDLFFKGWTDSSLMAQNLTNAVESLGLGAVFLGSILNDVGKVIELLKLPKLTFPVLGIGFGYPNDDPQLKPRMSMDLKIHENQYQEPESYLETLADYDEEMTHYYDTRENNRRSDTYTDQVLRSFQKEIDKRALMMQFAEQQGFDFRLSEEME
ncbi:NADPH-dependent oxidoreductase [Aerococcaceae bacterium DSM 111176]|nr:NADPH-dependent oxidoreductase [Aerococcaceae bacterium DSM 111176]